MYNTYKVYQELRDAKGINDAQVARDTGLYQPLFSEWKKGKNAPKVDKLYILAKYFGVPIEKFLEG